MTRRQLAAVALTLALTFGGLALDVSIDRSTDVSPGWLAALWGGFAVTLVVGLVTLNYVWDRVSPVLRATGIRPSRVSPDQERHELIERLTVTLAQGDEIQDRFFRESFPPEWTAEFVWGPIGDAVDWATGVENELRQHAPEWLPEFRTAGYVLPPDPEPDWITVADAEALLGARIPLLGRIVRGLRAEMRGTT